jgi:hypothetical protein
VATRSILLLFILQSQMILKRGSVSLNFFCYGIYDLVDYMRADEGTSIMKDEERAAVGVGRPPPVERVEDTCRGGRLT